MAAVGVAFTPTQRCEIAIIIGQPSSDSVKRNKETLSEIAAIGIRPSSDAWALFEEFAKRFSLVETSDKQGGPRDIQSVAKAGGGNRSELGFVLLTLFDWNGIDAEWVEVYGSAEAAREQDRTKAIRQLVLVPAIDRVFDPALPPAGQHKGPGKALFDGMSRVHYGGPVFTTYLCPNSIGRGSSHGTERRGGYEPTSESRHPII